MTVEYEARDEIAYISFNRPEKHNALRDEDLAALVDVLAALRYGRPSADRDPVRTGPFVLERRRCQRAFAALDGRGHDEQPDHRRRRVHPV